MAHLSKILISITNGVIKISLDRRNYESVVEKSLF